MYITLSPSIGIPYFIIFLFTKQSFPHGQNLCLAVHGTLPGSWGSLSKFCYTNERRNNWIAWSSPPQWPGEFLCPKGPYDSLLIASIARWAYIFQCAL